MLTFHFIKLSTSKQLVVWVTCSLIFIYFFCFFKKILNNSRQCSRELHFTQLWYIMFSWNEFPQEDGTIELMTIWFWGLFPLGQWQRRWAFIFFYIFTNSRKLVNFLSGFFDTLTCVWVWLHLCQHWWCHNFSFITCWGFY